ncbi:MULTISPECIES: phytoene desaturase family protein [Streptomyces]|uniref:phytoene desaturase family protein n=1 Tax=Streptomyces TaxID=1883 RepID=UPI00163B87C3|nr:MULTISPECIES: NAD(P)/FAD-dependent oxidoreductase [Streptomyces]MBC2878755.1 NAD(P)/FAD-dependent oxidoreductase [Streptomyces sp. TYQ1024]UBI39324.1 NAD(P)/FAD-dependent oxidoreductase [Streptomyces mobaraensis]UKW31904.1 NAD(P)/FAD-dependent oxidoreductase [Streptomyces sp. TYQ1024]
MARIAVIGAGMGAMAAAARLAVAGHTVTVYERGETYGGGVGRFARDGFVFDTGPQLLHLPAVYRDLFVKTGKESLEQSVGLTQVDPASAHLFADGTAFALPNASRAGVVRALDEAVGAGAGERWSELVNRAREAWDATRRPLLEEPLSPDPAERAALARDPYPARRGLFRRSAPATLAAVADRELRDPRLAALLESHALAHGLDPRTAPASATVLPYLEQTFGSWYVAGGLRGLADALHRRCVARRVEFRFGAEVAGVVEKDGRAAGVRLADGTVEETAFVVTGAPDPAAAPLSPGRFTVLLALRGGRPAGVAHRTVVHAPSRERELAGVFDAAGPGSGYVPTVTVLRPDDPAVRPDDGHEAVTLTATVAPHGRVDWGDAGVVAAFADRMLSAAEAAVPGVAERVVWREVRTPSDTAVVTGAPGGGVPAPALSGGGGAFLFPPNSGELTGLYRVGGFAHPGGGLAHAGMSGALVAGLIVEGEGFRGSQ